MLLRPGRRRSLEQRFWAKVRKSDACWVWTGARIPSGHGQIDVVVDEGPPLVHRMDGAHRVSWLLHFGPIPAGMLVRHRCDNPPCVRPDHLELGTQRDNIADAVDRRRLASGSRNGMHAQQRSKLTADQVLELRRRAAAGEKHRAIAADLGISSQTVSDILHGRQWTWLPSPDG